MLAVRLTKYPNTILVVFTGQFDHNSAADIEPLIVGAQELGCKYIILDFSAVTALDSFALKHLFMWHHQKPPHYVELSIVNPPPSIRAILEQSHLGDLIPIRPADSEMTGNGTILKDS